MSRTRRTLCLNMIVRDEAPIIERSLRSAADHVGHWVICDTGSSDATTDIVQSLFSDLGIPGELHRFPFENFEQARNQALDLARASSAKFDYILLMDADMELVVRDATFGERLTAPAYRVLQKSNISYWNTRLLARDVPARYRGVTHECLEVPPGEAPLSDIWFIDHADGSNRKEKFARDLALLKAAIEREPDNCRYVFYLAQTYRDLGQTADAAQAYRRRVAMDGWDEEAWYARWQEARCHRLVGDEGEFLAAALQAYDMRPWRAEPLYDIAKFYRERGANEAAALFCEMASGLPWPVQDKLFIDDFVYQTGLKEELSIAGYYCRSAARKQAGRAACFALALDARAPPASRALARQNLFFYAPAAEAVIPSTRISRIDFTPPDDYRAMNPSVTTWRGQLHVLLRSVNYRIDEAGRYKILHDAAVNSRNFLLRLDRDLQVTQAAEVHLPIDLPAPRHTTHQGFEDGRLFVWGDALWCSHTVRELSPTGMCQMVRARVDKPFADDCVLADWKVLRPCGDQRHEKNWMPLVEQDTLRFIYSIDPTRIIDEDARTLAQSVPDLSADHLRGGSQAIAFDGGWLALVHEAKEVASGRNYLHRFIWLDDAFALRRVSEPFCFKKAGIEFACGLTWHADAEHLIASFGVDDCAAYLATMLASEVRALLFGPRAHQATGLPDSIRH